MNDPESAANPRGPARWWVYQRERFPLLAHGPLVVAFSCCAVSYSMLLRGAAGLPDWRACLVAFTVSLVFFFHLRVADEFKDAEEDARHRPYRPVPRGLVTLRELAVIGAAGACLQLFLTGWWNTPLLWWLALAWLYFALMSREFWIGEWLRAHPMVYLLSHLFIMPLVDFYAAACDWEHATGVMPAGLWWFVAASYFNGMVLEVGRKLRAPADEERGVPTYTAEWGVPRALALWLSGLLVAYVCGVLAACRVGVGGAFAVVGAVPVLLAFGTAWAFRRHAPAGAGKRFELISGLWTLSLYLGLGLLPRLF